MNEANTLRERIGRYAHNPSAIRREVIDMMESMYVDGDLALDPMNPFVYLTQVMAVVGSAQMDQAETLTHGQYPSSAKSYADLYRHMSDKDYVGRFATPAIAPRLKILMGKDELVQRAVPVGNSGMRKLVIPKHTSITVGEVEYTFQYPIELRVMSHGGLQIVYDGSDPSPIQALESNRVEWTISNYNDERMEYLLLTVPVQQFSIKSVIETLTPSTTFRKRYSLKDQYYHARVYRKVGGQWSEIETTHSDQIFDPMVPTAVLRVTDGELEVKIPQVYQTSAILTGDLRIDVYTTKGPMEQGLGAYDPTQFVMKWRDLDKGIDAFSAPLSSITSLAVFGEGRVSGGSNGLSFEQLRERVMMNSLTRFELPITNAQMSAYLEDMGYDLLRNIDVITKRQFVATRSMPAPSTGNVSFGAGAMVGQVAFTFESLTDHPHIVDNGFRMTVTPDVLYRDDNGVVSMVDDEERNLLAALPRDRLADRVSEIDYLYTPFHYVLDINNNTFVTRPYYLDNPEITGKGFVEENSTLGIQVASDAHALSRTDTGWVLKVMTASGDLYKDLPDDEVFAQLLIHPVGEVRPAHVNGVQVGRHPDTNERIFEFAISTNWDITPEHCVVLNSFAMFDTQTSNFMVDLNTEVEIIYGVADPQVAGQQPSAIDDDVGQHILPAARIGVYQERLALKLGVALSRLWVRARSTITDMDYVRHAEDVYDIHPEDVYETDQHGLVVTIVDDKPTFNRIHRAGDVRKDSQGNDIILYPKGTPVLDVNGSPVIQSGRKIRREMDLVLFDGAYHFASTQGDITYRRTIPELITGWLDALNVVEGRLLEETRLFFRPRTTMGLVNVIVGEGLSTRIRAEQDLGVTLYVRQTVYRDNPLRNALTQTVHRTVAELLARPVVTTTEIISVLRATLGEDVIAIEMTSVGDQSNRTAITLTDPSARLSVGKRLVAQPDGTMAVQDKLNVTFIRHVED